MPASLKPNCFVKRSWPPNLKVWLPWIFVTLSVYSLTGELRPCGNAVSNGVVQVLRLTIGPASRSGRLKLVDALWWPMRNSFTIVGEMVQSHPPARPQRLPPCVPAAWPGITFCAVLSESIDELRCQLVRSKMCIFSLML